jgi:hypothetical protein
MVTPVLAIAAIILLLSLQRWFAPTVLKPGALSTPHAQILSGTLPSARCASCHPGAAKPAEFFASEIEGHAAVAQSDRCLDCHHATIQRENATHAHNLNRQTLESIRFASATAAEDSSWHDMLPRPADPDSVQCSVCHREHQGATADLLAISDTQCQTCHHDRFGSFAESHPDWDRWPYGRGGDVSFDHGSHATKHFPASQAAKKGMSFQCTDCHRTTADHELVRTVSYEIGCRGCHDQSLRIESAQGIELLAMPTLSDEAAQAVQPWPATATGFYDGRVAPLAALLLRADSESAAALRELPDHDFAVIRSRDNRAAGAGNQVAIALRDLLGQVGSKGQSVIETRLATAGLAPSTVREFLRSLPPQLFADAYRVWFEGSEYHARDQIATPFRFANHPQTEFDLLGDALVGSDLLDDDLLNDDLLTAEPGVDDLDAGDPLATPDASSNAHRPLTDAASVKHFDASVMLPSGGWYRDNLRLAIRYRGSGHADPVIRSTIDIVSQLSPADPVRRQLLATRAVAACVACHPAAVNSTGKWRSPNTVGRPTDFTKFSHAPHLNVAPLADCRHCHEINRGRPEAVTASGFAGAGSAPSLPSGSGEFLPMSRESCADCHTAHAAGDGCVKCHRYHVGGRPAWHEPSLEAAD